MLKTSPLKPSKIVACFSRGRTRTTQFAKGWLQFLVKIVQLKPTFFSDKLKNIFKGVVPSSGVWCKHIVVLDVHLHKEKHDVVAIVGHGSNSIASYVTRQVQCKGERMVQCKGRK